MRFEDLSGFFWGAGDILLSTIRQEHTPKTKNVSKKHSKRGGETWEGARKGGRGTSFQEDGRRD